MEAVMRLWLACIMAVLAAGGAARAQDVPLRNAVQSCLADGGASLGAAALLDRTIGAAKPAAAGSEPAPEPAAGTRAEAHGLYLRPRNLVGVSGRYIEVAMPRPRGLQTDWADLELVAAARPADGSAPSRGPSGVFARFLKDPSGRVIEEAGLAVVRIDLPPLGSFLNGAGPTQLRESWLIALALCDARKAQMHGWASYEFRVGSSWLAAGGTAVVLLLLLLLALHAATVAHRSLLRRVWAATRGEDDPADPPRAWLYWRMLHPAALTQTSEGDASLGRFQIMVFTFVVVGVLLLVFFSTFSIPVLSGDILALLGITALGSFGARIASNSGSVSTANIAWLSAKGVVAGNTRLPRMSDLVIADGEVDLTRVQAFFFTLLVCSSLIFSGTADLAGFTVPAQTMQLLGLSQLTYVAGKAIPAEGVRRLNAELDALRTAERQAIEARARVIAAPLVTTLDDAARAAEEIRAAEALAQARQRWTDARAAAATTLEPVYGERFRAERLAALEPGAA
jgi:hypothetical protein